MNQDDITIIPGEYSGSNVADLQVSPDGKWILEDVDTFDETLGGWVLVMTLRDSLNGNILDTQNADSRQAPRWTPTENKIVFSIGGDLEGIWTSDINFGNDGTPSFGATSLLFSLGGPVFDDATDPRWSPDAGHIVFRQSVWKKGAYQINLFRMKADGSGLVQLSKDIFSTRIWPYRWCSDFVAPTP